MFTKSKPSSTIEPECRAAKPVKLGPPSIVAADMRVFGNLESDGDVQVDGRIEGDLRIKSVTVGETATVNGAIFGETVRIAGIVNGEIRGKSVTLCATAKVVGDIHHQSLAIDAGAFLQGLCKRVLDEPAEDQLSIPAPAPSKPGNGQTKKIV